MIPASGGAAVPSPGMNLAINNERKPCLENAFSGLRTQESGSRDILQRKFNTFIPLRLPRSYHATSAINDAHTARAIAMTMLSSPVADIAPAASNIGNDGIGSPDCSANTQKNS